jgi:hypothetical protein
MLILLRFALSLTIAIVMMFLAMGILSRLWACLLAPLRRQFGTTRSAQHDAFSEYSRGFFRLWSVYGLLAAVFGITGGNVARTWVSPVSPPLGGSSPFLFGVLAGVVVCALARLLAVSVSGLFAKQIHVIVVAGVGLLAWQFSHDPNFLSSISDASHREFWDLPSFVLALSFIGCAVTEFFVYLTQGPISVRLIPGLRRVPYSLVQERCDEHERVEQIFVSPKVRERTRELIDTVIEVDKEGPISICWLTQTAPMDHLDVLLEATTRWVQSEKGYDRGQAEATARVFLARTVRIITYQGREAEIAARHSYLRQVIAIPQVIRTRILILNYSHAVVHVPIPFDGHFDEESNFAAVLDRPDRVARVRDWFEAMWCALASAPARQLALAEEPALSAAGEALLRRCGWQRPEDVLTVAEGYAPAGTGRVQLEQALRDLIEWGVAERHAATGAVRHRACPSSSCPHAMVQMLT